MHRTKQYCLVKVDFDTYRAHAIPTQVDYYTSCTSHSKIEVIKVMSSCEKSDIVKVGKVEINSQVYGYCKVKLRTGNVFDHGKFISHDSKYLLLFIYYNICIEMLYPPLPPHVFITQALWIDLPTTVLRIFNRHFFANGDVTESAEIGTQQQYMEELLYSAIHAVNHVILRIANMHCQCDAGDLGTEHEHLFLHQDTSVDKNVVKSSRADNLKSAQSKPPPR